MRNASQSQRFVELDHDPNAARARKNGAENQHGAEVYYAQNFLAMDHLTQVHAYAKAQLRKRKRLAGTEQIRCWLAN